LPDVEVSRAILQLAVPWDLSIAFISISTFACLVPREWAMQELLKITQHFSNLPMHKTGQIYKTQHKGLTTRRGTALTTFRLVGYNQQKTGVEKHVCVCVALIFVPEDQ
jgi:hypothetical protein